MEKIDFVLLWVDGSDAEWLKEKKKYTKEKTYAFTKNLKQKQHIHTLY